MRRIATVLLICALTACGAPLGSVSLPDLNLLLPDTGTLPVTVTTPVIYQAKNQYEGQGPIPALVHAVSVQGSAEYMGTGSLQRLDVYVRQNLDGCLQALGYAYCGSSEDGQFVGTVDFSKSRQTSFSFASPALLNAARVGQVYVGAKVTGSGFVTGDQLHFYDLRAIGRF